MIEKDFTGTIRASQFDTSREVLEQMLRADLKKLQMAGLTPTVGDARCLLFGHIIRLAVWQLRSTWRSDVPVKDKLEQVRAALQQMILVFDQHSGTGRLYAGDAGWETPYEVVHGIAQELILKPEEGLWLQACWEAATARDG